jgi:hypothetical protein
MQEQPQCRYAAFRFAAMAANSAGYIDVCFAAQTGQAALRSEPPHARNRWPSTGHRSPHRLPKILSPPKRDNQQTNTPLPDLPPARPPKSAKRTKPQQHDTNNTRIRENGPQNQAPNASTKAKRGPRADKAHHHPSSHPQKWAVTNPEPHVTAPSQPLSTLEKGMDTNTARSENASI